MKHELFTVRDVARAAFANDAMPGGIALKGLELATQITLQTVLGRNAAFSDSGTVQVDLGNGFVLSCQVEPKATTR
ncbi:MAG: hypothetical protein QM702_04340 [Rubrivivax sp.]